MKQSLPVALIIPRASSKELYLTWQDSIGIPSFTECPFGNDKSSIIHIEPSFFGAAPSGEQCILGRVGASNGPAV